MKKKWEEYGAYIAGPKAVRLMGLGKMYKITVGEKTVAKTRSRIKASELLGLHAHKQWKKIK